MSRNVRLASICVLAIALAGCGSSPTTPTSFTGTWTGTIVDNLAGAGTEVEVLTQTGNSIQGSWANTFANPINDASGTFLGTANGASFSAVVTVVSPFACSVAVTGSVSGTTSTGTYAATACALAIGGSFSLKKQ